MPEGGGARVIEAADGIGLRYAFWPATGRARGAILLASGRTEYIEKSYPWIELFRRRGLAVGTFDFRGQGLSERQLPNRRAGFVRDFGEFQHDYDAAFGAVRGDAGGLPILVFGHSMGGLVAARFLSRRQDDVAGAILSAPMLGLALSPMLGWVAWLISGWSTGIGLGARYVQGCDDRSGPDRGFENNVLTHDADRFARHEALLAAYPDLVLGGTTHAWLRAAFKEMEAVQRLPRGWLERPVLILTAGEDRVVSNAAIDRFVEANPLAERCLLPGSRHEPLMEVDAVQNRLWAAVDGWLDRVLADPEREETPCSSASS